MGESIIIPSVPASTLEPDPMESSNTTLGLLSFAGRTAQAAVPTAGDYKSSEVNDDSSVTGGTVKAALEWLATNRQTKDATLTALAALTTSADQMIYATGADAFAMATLTSYARSLNAAGNATAARVVLELIIGTDVQAYDAGLQSIADLTTAADKMIYATGSDVYATTDLSAYGRTLVALADAAAGRVALELGTLSLQDADDVTITGGIVTAKRGSRAVSSTDTATTADDTIEASGTYTQTLYTLTGNAKRIIFITNVGTGMVTLTGDGAETIMGNASFVLHPGESISLIVNAAEDNWILRG
jgi:hypothetical protein